MKEIAFYGIFESLKNMSEYDFGNNPIFLNSNFVKQKKQIFDCSNQFLQQLQVILHNYNVVILFS